MEGSYVQDEAPGLLGLCCLAEQCACLYLPCGLRMAQGPLPSPISAGAFAAIQEVFRASQETLDF